MKVSAQTPVEDKNSFLYKWDSQARKYFNHFEIHKVAAKEGLQSLLQNILTRWRDPIQYRHRYQDIDAYTYRQLLGDISKEEVAELNKVFGGFYCFSKSQAEPAKIVAYRQYQIYAFAALGVATVGLKFVKGYNVLWLGAAFAPLATYLVYNYLRQPY